MNSERLAEILSDCGYYARPFNPKNVPERPWGPGEEEILARLNEPSFIGVVLSTVQEVLVLGMALGHFLTPEEMSAFYPDDASLCIPFGYENAKFMVYWPGFQWTEGCNNY